MVPSGFLTRNLHAFFGKSFYSVLCRDAVSGWCSVMNMYGGIILTNKNRSIWRETCPSVTFPRKILREWLWDPARVPVLIRRQLTA